jgi:hypothetical protein
MRRFVGGGGAVSLHFAVGLPLVVSQPLAVAVTLLVVMNSGPTYERWRLTGNHKIVPGTIHRQEGVKI